MNPKKLETFQNQVIEKIKNIIDTDIKAFESNISINELSSSINKLNTIISTKLGVVIDNDLSGDDSHKVA